MESAPCNERLEGSQSAFIFKADINPLFEETVDYRINKKTYDHIQQKWPVELFVQY